MITRSFQVCHQQYADDTQLFIALNPSDPSSDIFNLTSCLHALQSWFCLNGMALNPDKSDAILLGTRQTLCRCCRLLSFVVKIFGVTLDSHLSLDRHISSICKSAYYHIRSLRHIRSAITDDIRFFWHFFANGLAFLMQILHASFPSTLEYEFLFSYLQLWRSNAILNTNIHLAPYAQIFYHRPKRTLAFVANGREF